MQSYLDKKEIGNGVLYHGDNSLIIEEFPDNYFHTIITDAPYGLKLKGNKWDYSIPQIGFLSVLLRKTKPGGTMLMFGGTRTWHRLAVNIEDAGWNINDTIMWVHNQGMPKSVDISYMIDKNRNQFGKTKQKMIVGGIMTRDNTKRDIEITEPGSIDSEKWYGWNTGLKPAYEPIIVASKSIEFNYDKNALVHGVAGYWIDGVRIKDDKQNKHYGIKRTSEGRWPSNVIVSESAQKFIDRNEVTRFFFCPKPTKKEKGDYNIHDTVKPIKLMEYLAKLTKTPDGGIVLDPYAGSGTTGIACELANREYVLIEKEKNHFDIMVKRMENFQNEKRIYT